MTYLKMKEKICLNKQTSQKCTKMKCQWDSEFLGAEPETDIPSYVIFFTGNTEHMQQFTNHFRRW